MEYSQRKHPRLKKYDYSLPGYYYVTVHAVHDAPLLSRVGRGLAPAGAVVSLTTAGEIAERQLFALEKRYPNVLINKYVIMPTHIHVIVRLTERNAEAGSSPTLMDVIGAYKSLTTRACNQFYHTPGRKLFQESFYDTVLRNEKAYQKCWLYIDANPANWLRNPEDI
ncbi:MAG: transposase [Faecousia sp.]